MTTQTKNTTPKTTRTTKSKTKGEFKFIIVVGKYCDVELELSSYLKEGWDIKHESIEYGMTETTFRGYKIR